MYPESARNRRWSQAPPESVSRWKWCWWKAKPRVAGGVSRWSGITISDVACRSAPTCVTGCATENKSWRVCSGPLRHGRCKPGTSGLDGVMTSEGKTESRRWREQMERYHYLGCRVPFGANLRYWVRHGEQELACLLWTSPAWKMQARDKWIGWSDDQRRHNLQRIVNNGRFLILPWVKVKGLASKILALSARQVPHDWESRYCQRPLLLETLVDATRFRGTCYRAAVLLTPNCGSRWRLSCRMERP